MSEPLAAWLREHADGLDEGRADPAWVLPALAAADVFHVGVPVRDGGSGGDTGDAIEALARVAEHSLTAAFVLWGHRTFIEYLLQSPNAALRERWLARLLDGRVAGATALSNAMKFLSGVESLQIDAVKRTGGWRLQGQMPWVTNLRPSGFVVAAAVARDDAPPAIVALDHARRGLVRSPDLDLLGLRSSHTAAIRLDAVDIDDGDVLAADGPAFLRRVRPAFLGLQCGLSIGLARASLAAARQASGDTRHALRPRLAEVQQRLDDTTGRLLAGVRDGRFVEQAVPLFRLRLTLSEVVQDAVQLELQTGGGRAYLLDRTAGFARRWREAAFVPVVTPSVSQLEAELLKHAVVASG